jgi:aldose 1-epimerase
MPQDSNYTAERMVLDGTPVIRLADAARQAEVRVAPSLGNNAYQFTVGGKSVFWWPYRTLAEWKAMPVQSANPFLAPWANRIDQDAYWVNGKKYLLNPSLGNYRKDTNGNPIHGLLVNASDWKIISVWADEKAALLVSRLEFWRKPEWMAQFPFAHNIEMTYRLAGGVLEIQTAIENVSDEAMPVLVGYHTYYQINDAPRDDWRVHVAARDRFVLSKLLIPTGDRKQVSLPDPVPLGSTQLDDVFSNLVRDKDGKAAFSVQGRREKISVLYGPKYTVSVVYAPPGRDFICFEPMSGITDAFNLAHAGIYKELQSVRPGKTWKESFWIQPSGFV